MARNPKLITARQLIEEKNYDAARALLKTMPDDTTAQRWLKRLDEIKPPKQAKRSRMMAEIGVLLAILGIAVFVLIQRIQLAATPAVVQVVTAQPTATLVIVTMLPVPVPTDMPPSASDEAPTATLVPADNPALIATSSCDPATWWTSVSADVHDFLDTADLASKTARIGLGTVVLQMQQFQHDYEHQPHPDCASDAYYELDNGMSDAVEGFSDFMAQNEVVSDVDLELATQYFWDPTQMLTQLGVGITDARMLNTAVFIWGGDSPNAATATHLIIELTPTDAPTAMVCNLTEAAQAVQWLTAIQPIINQLSQSAQMQPSTVQTLRAQVAALPFPACVAAPREHLLNSLNDMVYALVSLDPNETNRYTQDAQNEMNLFEEGMRQAAPSANPST